MATKAKKRPRRKAKGPKQPPLAGMPDDVRDKELDTAVEAYVEARDRRMVMTDEESEAKKALIKLMKDRNVEVYRYNGYIANRKRDEVDDVKVRKINPDIPED